MQSKRWHASCCLETAGEGAYSFMMRKADVDEYAAIRPFRPFEVRMVDGRRFRFNRIEQFLVAREHLVTLDHRARTVFLNIGLIVSIGPTTKSGRRRPRKD
jgi:hypothetical protein